MLLDRVCTIRGNCCFSFCLANSARTDLSHRWSVSDICFQSKSRKEGHRINGYGYAQYAPVIVPIFLYACEVVQPENLLVEVLQHKES